MLVRYRCCITMPNRCSGTQRTNMSSSQRGQAGIQRDVRPRVTIAATHVARLMFTPRRCRVTVERRKAKRARAIQTALRSRLPVLASRQKVSVALRERVAVATMHASVRVTVKTSPPICVVARSLRPPVCRHMMR